MEYFFSPNSGEDQIKTKKKVFIRNGTLFLNTYLHSDAHQSQIIGGDANKDHTQIVGGIQSNYCGGYIPPSPPPLVSAPLIIAYALTIRPLTMKW